MAQEITYDQDEICEIESLVESLEKLFDDDIKKDLSNDFTSLFDIGFTGLSKLKEQTNTLATNHNALGTELKKHDNNMTSLENAIDVKIKSMIDTSLIEDTNNTSAARVLSEIEFAKVNKGKKVSIETLTTSVHEFSYNSKVTLLKNILKYDNGSVTSLLTDPDKANILVYEIRQMFNDKESEMSTEATEEEKQFQTELLNSLAEEKENVFKDVDEETFLRGLPYYKKIADLNGMKVSDLVIDKKNEKLLTDCIKYVYEHTFVNGLLQQDLSAVKGYVKGVSSKNNITPGILLSSKTGASLIKGGI